MLFKTDENLPAEIAALLRENGLDCVTVHAQGLAGQPDIRVSEVCREEGRVLVLASNEMWGGTPAPPTRRPRQRPTG